MNESTVTKMKQMTLHGMHNAFKTAIESGKTDHYTLDQLVSMLIDAEWDERHNRRIERSIKNAKFHYQSSIETLNFDTSRNLDRNLVLRLSECEFVEKNENILITGSTGVGKSYLGTALGYQACIEGYKVNYFNTSKLFAKLKMAKADGSYLRELTKIGRQDVRPDGDFARTQSDNRPRFAHGTTTSYCDGAQRGFRRRLAERRRHARREAPERHDEFPAERFSGIPGSATARMDGRQLRVLLRNAPT